MTLLDIAGIILFDCAPKLTEVKRINRQKFLAELGRLLTFMYEEDRQTALAMYNRMFDEAEDEQALIQYLVSPTRQAVVLARAYNAKERKLQVHSQSRDEYEQVSDEIPDFVLAINKLQEEVSALKITTSQVSEDQISLFDDGIAAAAEETEPTPVPASASAVQEYTAPAANEEETETPPPAPAEEAPAQEETAPVTATEPAEEAEQDEMNSSVTQLADAVDAFLADFTISNDELIQKAKPAGEEEIAETGKTGAEITQEIFKEKTEESVFEMPVSSDAGSAFELPTETDLLGPAHKETEPFKNETAKPVKAAKAKETVEIAETAAQTEEVAERAETVRKPIVPLLILYIIIAIPIGLIGILLLLLLALMSLSLAVTVGFFGIYGFAATFTGFAVLADILVVAGGSLILLALALLFLWLFVWFIGGGIVGLIRGLCALGGSWCYKEVAVQ